MNFEIPLLVVFPVLMACAAASDLLTMTIPNKLSLLLVAGFAALAIVTAMRFFADQTNAMYNYIGAALTRSS